LCYVFARGGFILGFVVLADKDKAAAPGGEEEKKEAGAGQDARYDGDNRSLRRQIDFDRAHRKLPAVADEEWRAVVDERSGRTYYYNPVTLETREWALLVPAVDGSQNLDSVSSALPTDRLGQAPQPTSC
jgi:hypothetical protein